MVKHHLPFPEFWLHLSCAGFMQATISLGEFKCAMVPAFAEGTALLQLFLFYGPYNLFPILWWTISFGGKVEGGMSWCACGDESHLYFCVGSSVQTQVVSLCSRCHYSMSHFNCSKHTFVSYNLFPTLCVCVYTQEN